MTGNMTDTELLEDLFVDARSDPFAQPSDALMQRIETDASGLIVAPDVLARTAPKRRGLFATLLAAIGGWSALGGLATATIAGIGIGFGVAGTDLTPGVDSLTGTQDTVWLDDLSIGYMAELDEG